MWVRLIASHACLQPCSRLSDVMLVFWSRFQAHMERLSLLLAARAQKRQQQQVALIDGVASFESSVRAQQLGGSSTIAAASATSAQLEQGKPGQGEAVLAPEAWGFDARQSARGLARVRTTAAAGASASAAGSPAGMGSTGAVPPQSPAGPGPDSSQSAAEPSSEEAQYLSGGSSTPRLRAALARRQRELGSRGAPAKGAGVADAPEAAAAALPAAAVGDGVGELEDRNEAAGPAGDMLVEQSELCCEHIGSLHSNASPALPACEVLAAGEQDWAGAQAGSSLQALKPIMQVNSCWAS